MPRSPRVETLGGRATLEWADVKLRAAYAAAHKQLEAN